MRRVGLLIPSPNTVMEPDFTHAFRGRATIHAARMYLRDPVTREGELQMLDEFVQPAARDIATLRPDVVVFGCTSAGSLLGAEADATLRRRLSELVSAPVVGIIDAIGQSLRQRGARRVSVFTPYVDDLNFPIAESLRAQGFQVQRITGLGLANVIDIGAIKPAQILEEAVKATVYGSDALVIPCTNFRALEVREEIAVRTGMDVVTACSAAVDLVRDALDDLG